MVVQQLDYTTFLLGTLFCQFQLPKPVLILSSRAMKMEHVSPLDGNVMVNQTAPMVKMK